MSRIPSVAALAMTAVLLAGCADGASSQANLERSAGRERPHGAQALDPLATASPGSTDGGLAGLPSGGGSGGVPGLNDVERDDMSADPSLGVQVFAMWRDYDLREQLMDRIVAAGSHWMRFDLGWCTLEEAGPGQISAWYLERLDNVVAAAQKRGLSMLVTLTCSPGWARADGRLKALPEDPSQYQRVAAYLAERYRGRIAAWEMWNEPDCLDLGCGRGSAEQYAQLLKAGYRGIKAGDPKATVVSGGTSGIDLTWIKTLLDNGGGDYMDALALNSYENPSMAPPDTAPTRGFQDKYRLTNAPAAEDLLKRSGYADLPVWITEIGWSTGRVPDRPRYDGVSVETQAAYLTQSVDQINERYPFITHVFWFTARDRDDSTPNENGFGMLELDLTPKPAYAAFGAANAGLGG